MTLTLCVCDHKVVCLTLKLFVWDFDVVSVLL